MPRCRFDYRFVLVYGHWDADAPLALSLLRACLEWPRLRHNSKKGNELAPPHLSHSFELTDLAVFGWPTLHRIATGKDSTGFKLGRCELTPQTGLARQLTAKFLTNEGQS